MNIRAVIICFILLLVSPVYAGAGLQRAGSCGGCHVDNFNAWSSSAHSRSISSNRFRRALVLYLLDKETDDGRFCFRCHAPGVLISGNRFDATKGLVRGKSRSEGVSCIVCHSVESVKDGRAVYDPGDSPGYHRVKDLSQIERGSLCSSCHASFKSPEPEKAVEKGVIKGLTSRFGELVTKKSKKSDHTFSGSIAAANDRVLCPGIGYGE